MLGPMAASKPIEPEAGSGLPRWQLALLVGTPIVLGVGAAYLWNRSRSQASSSGKDKPSERNEERKTPEGSEQDNMVTHYCLRKTSTTLLHAYKPCECSSWPTLTRFVRFSFIVLADLNLPGRLTAKSRILNDLLIYI